MIRRTVMGLAVGAVVCLTVSGQNTQRPLHGGTLRVGTAEEIAVWDVHRSTSVLIRKFAAHIFEKLFTEGSDYSVKEELADSYTLSTDGLVYTIRLRRGVLFHNGEEMTADDVVASLNHWGAYGPMGSMVYAHVASVSALDRYTVRIELKDEFGFLLSALATSRQGAFIYPKAVLERLATTKTQITPTATDLIGTGPYRFVEFRPDSFTRIARFDEYVPRDEAPDGYGGRKVAYFDEILFVPVLDPTVRAIALETGEIDFAMDLSVVDYERLSGLPGVVALKGEPKYAQFVFNMGKGTLADNAKLRQAMLAALDFDEMALAAIGSSEFYRIDGSMMWKETVWWTDVGTEVYNEASTEKARALLKEAGYNGERVRVVSSLGYPVLYDVAVVAVGQWRKVGINIEHRALEWGEADRVRRDPNLWEVSVGQATYRTDPALFTVIWNTFWNGWIDPYKDDLVQRMVSVSTQEARFELWEEFHAYYYEQVPFIRAFDYFTLSAMKGYVKGYLTSAGEPRMADEFFWNVWFEKG